MASVGKYKEITAAIAFLLVSVLLYYNTESIRVIAPNSANYINARFFPYVLSILLGVTSIAQLVSAIRQLPGGDVPVAGGLSRVGVARVVATFALLGAYLALLDSLGFLIMTAVYVFLQALVLTPRKHISVPFALGLAVVSSTLIYVLFSHVLTMVLPRAPFLSF